jgi:hypothetical protein
MNATIGEEGIEAFRRINQIASVPHPGRVIVTDMHAHVG